MNQLAHIIYISSSKGLMSEEELVNLLTSIRKKNTQYDVTGMLLYQDGNIMQVIEGERATLEQLFNSIERDERHSGIITLIDEDIPERDFGDWSMSYKNVSGIEVEGFSNLVSSKTFHDESISQAKRMLKGFIR